MQKRTIYLYKRLLSYSKPFWKLLLLGILANIAYTTIDASLTYLTKPFLEKGFIDIDPVFIHKIPLLLLIIISVRGTANAIAGYCMTAVARSVIKVIRQDVFAHILYLPAKFYDQTTSGQLLSKLLYDVEQVAQVSADALTDFVQNSFLVIGLISVMMALCWQLSLMFLVTVPFIGCIVNITNKRIRRLSQRVQQNMSDVTHIAHESIDGYRVIRIFGGHEYERNKFNIATNTSLINDIKMAVSRGTNVVGVQIVIAIGIAAIILASIQLSKYITVSAGAFVGIIAAMLQLIKPLKTLTTLNATFQRGLAGADSIFSLLDEKLENNQGIVLPHKSQGRLLLKNVSFAYDDQTKVLNNINFVVNPGEKIALVGQSGSGKSTIASLIPRFYELKFGEILLDEHNIQDLSLSYLRKQISFVSQHVVLFNDTVANNIAYGNQNASMDDIINAAKLAQAHNFIENLPEGYQTSIGENGLMLSGGQRQRLAIARAILKNAPILILDEATSALDSESEYALQIALEAVMQNKTTLIIAHRLSTIKNADKIIVLNKGEIVETGTHAELLEYNSFYSNLHNQHHAAATI
jgi:subfamily B ATP-binding cassette protein MsbA